MDMMFLEEMNIIAPTTDPSLILSYVFPSSEQITQNLDLQFSWLF